MKGRGIAHKKFVESKLSNTNMISRISRAAFVAAIMVAAGAQADLAPFTFPLDELPLEKPKEGMVMNKMIQSKFAQGRCTRPDDGGFIRTHAWSTAQFENFGIPVILADGVTQTTVPIPLLDLPLNLLIDTLSNEPFVQSEQTFGRDGRHTEELKFQQQLAMDFWKTEEETNVILAGWHSEPLGDLTQMSRAIRAYLEYQNSYGENLVELLALTDSDITDIALEAMATIESELPNTYSNPLLTFNAFATPFIPINEGYPGTIVMGDGIMEYITSLGLGEITNDVVHAHEFGHILQFIVAYEEAGFDVDKFIDIMFDTTPEESRRIELKADAYASYFLAHQEGRNFEISLLMQAARASFAIGDCNTESEGHHGTPSQRQCATLWGADLGLQNGRDPISFREFRDLFDENLSLILDVDPSVCSGELIEEDFSEPEVKRSDDLLIGGPKSGNSGVEDDESSSSSGDEEVVDLAADNESSSSSYSWTRLSILGALLTPLILFS